MSRLRELPVLIKGVLSTLLHGHPIDALVAIVEWLTNAPRDDS